MASIRLNMTHRQALRRFAAEAVSSPPEQKARDRAYAKAAKQVREAVEKVFPPADMAILAKYEKAAVYPMVRGGSPAGELVAFEFDKSDNIPPRANHYAVPLSQAAADAVGAYIVANDALKAANAKKLDAYNALITAARTFEEVLEIWPAAIALAERIGAPSTAIVALSDDVRDFIRADNAAPALAA